MTLEALRVMARAHGVLAWIAAAGLAAALGVALRRRAAGGPRSTSGAPGPGKPALRPGPRARPALAALAAASALLTATFGTGLALDLPYRGRLRQQVFLDSPALGWLFERKMHLAFGATALAWCALALLAASARARTPPAGTPAPGTPPRTDDLGRGGRLALAASVVFGLLAAVLSVAVTRRHPF